MCYAQQIYYGFCRHTAVVWTGCDPRHCKSLICKIKEVTHYNVENFCTECWKKTRLEEKKKVIFADGTKE